MSLCGLLLVFFCSNVILVLIVVNCGLILLVGCFCVRVLEICMNRFWLKLRVLMLVCLLVWVLDIGCSRCLVVCLGVFVWNRVSFVLMWLVMNVMCFLIVKVCMLCIDVLIVCDGVCCFMFFVVGDLYVVIVV